MALRRAGTPAAAAVAILVLTLGQVPAAVAGTTAVPTAPNTWARQTYDGVAVSWFPVDETEQVTSYTIYRASPTELLAKLAEAPADARRYLDASAEVGVRYTYAVSATNDAGEGPRGYLKTSERARPSVLVTTDRYAANPSAEDAPLNIARLTPDGKMNLVTPNHSAVTYDYATLSPDGSAVVYAAAPTATGDFDLWFRYLEEPPFRITEDPDSADIEPAFSPDGRSVAFTRVTASGPTVRVLRMEGGVGETEFASPGDSAPAWSPNGRMLAVVHDGTQAGKATAWLQVVSLDGAYRRSVAGTVDATGAFAALDPSWSPDGASLSYTRVDLPETETDELRTTLNTVPVLGGAPTTLASSTGDDPTLVLDQHWAPAGDRIVFSGFRPGNAAMLWSVPPGGGTPQAAPGSDQDFVVSPTVTEPAAAYVRGDVPPAVTGLAATLDTQSAVLRWTPAPGAAYYVARRSEPGKPAPKTPEQGESLWAGKGATFDTGGLGGPGVSLAVTVFPMSARGDAGPARTLAVDIAEPPYVRPASPVVATLSGDGPSFVASWGPALRKGQKYELQIGTRTMDAKTKKWSAPAYKALTSGTATSKVVSGTAGQTYYVRGRIKDAAGNVTGWGDAQAMVVPYDDRSFTARGTWSDLTGQAGRYQRTVRQSKEYRASLTLKRYGSSFALLVDKCPTCGYLDIYVDGDALGGYSLYSKTLQTRRVIPLRTFSSIGEHTVRVEVVHAGKRKTARIDGVIVRR